MISQKNKTGLRNPWVLGMVGLVIFVLVVNGAFVWYATHNRSTLVDRDYDTGDRKSGASLISEIQEKKALAWKTTIKQPKSVVMGSAAGYEISVVDRGGMPVSGTLEVEAYRASDESKDFTTAFREVAPGNYQGYVSFPLKGYWELRIRIKRGKDVFEVGTDRFMVAAAP